MGGRHRAPRGAPELNPTLRGWCNYFRHGVSSRTFNYVDHFAFWRIVGWLRKRHVGLNMHTLVRRYLPGWRVSDGRIEMFRPYKVNIERRTWEGWLYLAVGSTPRAVRSPDGPWLTTCEPTSSSKPSRSPSPSVAPRTAWCTTRTWAVHLPDLRVLRTSGVSGLDRPPAARSGGGTKGQVPHMLAFERSASP
ncbi:MAG: hypothetical protein LC733_04815 [Actinobacteria bacterium]|nr:hypothetical protein [Actinomycetota bacterium]